MDSCFFSVLGASILMNRSPLNGTSFQDSRGDRSAPPYVDECELFLPVTEKSLPAMKTNMEHLWRQGIPLCIEVKGQRASSASTTTLLERWLIETVAKRPQAHHTSLNLLMQAVQSFLHFSQIRSWSISCDGSLPFDLLCRVCTPAEENWEKFTLCKVPETHVFPPAMVTQQLSVQVTVTYLPRSEVIPSLLCSESNQCSHPERPLRCVQVDALLKRVGKMSISARREVDDCERKQNAMMLPTTSRTEAEVTPENGGTHIPRDRTDIPLEMSKMHKLTAKLSKTSLEKSSARTELGTHSLNCGTFISKAANNESSAECCDTCSEVKKDDFRNTDCIIHEGQNNSENRNVILGREHVPLPLGLSYHCAADDVTTPMPAKAQPSGPSAVCHESDASRVPNPLSFSSKAPSLVIRPKHAEHTSSVMVHRRSSFLPVKTSPHKPPQRSMSVPAAVPSLCLLGTFEESVLNGRIEACGYLEGFEAELAASGSFCPRHIRFPMTTKFFDLSKDTGASPYLGHIDLTKSGKKGYHIPSKGTIQVTLFNPNNSVVKIFIVTYDLSDMPSSTQTFLRQRTLSKSSGTQSHTTSPSLPVLHYLIHLRFVSSKSSRVYLHRDIRVIFARRAPDSDPDISKVSLSTLTEGPANPKYSPVDCA